MKFMKALSAASFITLSFCAVADDSSSDTDTLLTNLGSYLGYQISGDYQGPSPYSALLDVTATTNLALNVMYSFFGAVPVNAFNTTLSQFMPASDSGSNANLATLNGLANTTFTTAGYNAEGGSSSGSSSVAVNPLLDQENYQNDPVNQSILNILGTPDYTYCMNNDASAWLSDCNLLYNYSVVNNVVGATPPAVNDFFSYTFNQYVIPQLNSNTLIAPLLYDNSSSVGSSATTGTLTATTQIQEAANFIRYATYGTMPVNLPSYQDYSSTYATATSTSGNSPQTVADAQNTISAYIASLRSYASITSVPTSNLYYILSKRMPQTSPSNNKEQTSQALNEFIMATHRLSAQGTSNAPTPWITAINNASPATVEKEIAQLLAEINYQLYLNRQQEERQLLTNSLILMVMAHQQTPDFSNQSNSSSSSSTGSTDGSSS